MGSLPLEVVQMIVKITYKNIDVISFLSTSTYFHQLKSKITFREIIGYDPILETLPYYKKLRTKFFFDDLCPISIPQCTYFLSYGGKGPLKQGEIPNSVHIIVFNWYFCSPLKKGDIPNSVKEIFFGDQYGFTLYPGNIPNSLKKIHFGNYYNEQILPGAIPDSVKVLHFGATFNQPLTKQNLPKSLHTLVLGDKYKTHLDYNELSYIKRIIRQWPDEYYYC